MKAIISSLKIGVVMALSLCTQWSFSQRSDVPKDKTGTYAKPGRMVNFPVSCDPLPQVSCNIIQNNDFDPQTYSDDPFSTNLLPPWQTASGSCTVYPGANTFPFAPPAPATSYVFGYAGYYDSYGQYACESIVQKIPNVIPGHTYVLSFFISHRDYSNNPYIGVDYPLDHFNIHLINCDDYNETFTPNSFVYPTVPANSQQIYCQDNVANHAWKRVFVHFVAQQPNPLRPLNMIWIWPEGDPDPAKHSGMFVALPELFDITNYTNMVQQAANPGCLATLPSCGPEGSYFEWFGPPGSTSIPPTPAGTPVTLDLSNPQNAGTWSLTLSVPGADITTGACNTTGSFTTTVQVLPCGTLPTGPIRIVEIPNIQSAKPADIIRDADNNSIIGYASVDDIEVPDPDAQEVGFGIIKFDPAGNKLFNRQYKLAGKKLFLKKIHQSYDLASANYYYLLAGIRDGITCTCDDEKTLVIKIDKANGNLVSSMVLDGFHQNQLHEPFSLEVAENHLYVMSYGHDKTVAPAASGSKIYIVEVNLANNATRSFYTYDPVSTTSFIKPTTMFDVNWRSPIDPLPVMFYGGLLSPDRNFVDNKPFSFYSCSGCLLNGTVYTYDNDFVKTANVQQFDGILAVVAQGHNGKLYITNSGNGTVAYYNENFELGNEKSIGSLGGFGLGGQTYAMASGRYNTSLSNTTSGYGVMLFDNGGTLFHKKFNDLNQDFAATLADNTIMTANSNLWDNGFDMIAYKAPISLADRNKFYHYYVSPSTCDLNVSFPTVPFTLTTETRLTTVLNNLPVAISTPALTVSAEQPVIITLICYDAGSFTDHGEKKPTIVYTSLQTTNAQGTVLTTSNGQNQNSVKQETKTVSNIKSIELFSTTGQLVKRIGFPNEINSIMNNRAVGVVPGLYFIRILYNNKTTSTLKKLLQ